jgi:hypothetical protein
MTLIASTLILVIGHVENLFTLTAVVTAQREHIETAMLAFDFAAGNRAFGTLFYMVAVPALYLSLGSVLRGSNVLPQVFSYLAIALGIGFEIVGFAGSFSATTRSAFSAGSFYGSRTSGSWPLR